MNLQLRNFAIRLIILAVALLGLGRAYGAAIVNPMLPLFATVIEAANGAFRVDHIAIVRRQSDTAIEIKAKQIAPLFIGGKVLLPNDRRTFEPSTLLGSVLQPLILFLSIVCAWHARSPRAFGVRLLLGLPAMLILLVSNVPLSLAGAMLDFRQYFPLASFPPLVYWNDFLQTGGPLAMAVGTAVLVLSMAGRWEQAAQLPDAATNS